MSKAYGTAVVAFTAWLLATCWSLAAEPTTRPNVLFVLCDDLRPDALGCFGSKHVKTPHIDRLAADGRQVAHG